MSLKEIKPEAATNGVTSGAAVQPPTSSSPSKVLPLAASLQSNLHLLLARLGKLLKYQALLRSKICNGTATPQQLGMLPGWSDLASAAQKWQRDVEALNRWVSEAQDALLVELSRAKKREALQAEEDAKRAEVEAAEKAKRDAEEEAERLRKAAEDEAAAAKKAAAEATAQEESTKAEEAKKATAPTGGAGVIDLTDDDDVKPAAASNAGTAAKHPRDGDNDNAQNDGLDAKRQKTGGGTSSTDEPQATATTSGVPAPDPATLLAALTSQSQSHDSSSNQNRSSAGDFDFSSMGNMSDLFKMDDLTNFMGQGQGQGSGQGLGQAQTSATGETASGDHDGGFGTTQNGNEGDGAKLDDFSGMGGDDMDFKFDPSGFSMDGMGGSGGMDQFGSGGEGGGDMGGIDFNAALEGVDWGSLMDMIGNQGGS